MRTAKRFLTFYRIEWQQIALDKGRKTKFENEVLLYVLIRYILLERSSEVSYFCKRCQI